MVRRQARGRGPLDHLQPLGLQPVARGLRTAWTFYGSVGRAATDGVGFLPIYLGPTLMIALWWFVLRKIMRIAQA